MENLTPKPLRIARAPPLVKYGIGPASNSPLSYPRIPRRQSSLRVTSPTLSDGSGISTRTPSLDNSLERLEVSKTRNAHLNGSEKGSDSRRVSTGRAGNVEGAEALSLLPSSQNTTNPRSRIFTRFFRALNSGSWGPTTMHASLNSASHAVDKSPAPNPVMRLKVDGKGTSVTNLSGDYSQTDEAVSSDVLQNTTDDPSGCLAPCEVPIAVITIEATADNPWIGVRPVSIWTNVDVSLGVTDLNAMNRPVHKTPPPLDVVIILDNISWISTNTLKQAAIAPLVIVSSLNAGIDHYAIGYMDSTASDDFNLLLPLGAHRLECAHKAINAFQLYQLTKARSEEPDLYYAIQQASIMLQCSERAASRHIFLVTSNSSVHFTMPSIDQEICFHTVSPDVRFQFETPEAPLGWHIYSDIDTCDAEEVEISLKDKISTTFEYLRSGINHGFATNLRLKLAPGNGCEIQAVLDDTQMVMLRPGESWRIPVQIKIPAAAVKQKLQSGVTDPTTTKENSQTIEQLIDELHEMLDDSGHEKTIQHIMTARVEYRHSLLPMHSIIHSESRCKVVRNMRRDSDCVLKSPVGDSESSWEGKPVACVAVPFFDDPFAEIREENAEE